MLGQCASFHLYGCIEDFDYVETYGSEKCVQVFPFQPGQARVRFFGNLKNRFWGGGKRGATLAGRLVRGKPESSVIAVPKIERKTSRVGPQHYVVTVRPVNLDRAELNVVPPG
jgi:hypothetical protein